MIHFIIIVLFLGALSASDIQLNKSDLNSALRINGSYKVWVFFEDKGLNKTSLNFALNEVSNKLHNKTKKRRSKAPAWAPTRRPSSELSNCAPTNQARATERAAGPTYESRHRGNRGLQLHRQPG